MLDLFFVFFFFQAEDGIRDTSVTGVQTCALPICLIVSHRAAAVRDAQEILVLDRGRVVERGAYDGLLEAGGRFAELVRLQVLEEEIGRASCRERVWGTGVAGSVEKK